MSVRGDFGTEAKQDTLKITVIYRFYFDSFSFILFCFCEILNANSLEKYK